MVGSSNLADEYAAVAELRRWLASGEAAAVRRAAGVTQREVAQDVGLLNVQSIWNFEHGRSFPQKATALRLHALLRQLREAIAPVEGRRVS